MKKLLFFVLFVFACNQFPQQDKFIIGVDWINPTYPTPDPYYQLLSDAYWDTLKSFGVNYGALNIPFSLGASIINTELDQAFTRDISIFLWTYQLGVTHGRRWMYQVEDNYDFSSHISGVSLFEEGVEQHWSQVKVNVNAPNYWWLSSGIHQTGYVAEGLINDS